MLELGHQRCLNFRYRRLPIQYLTLDLSPMDHQLTFMRVARSARGVILRAVLVFFSEFMYEYMYVYIYMYVCICKFRVYVCMHLHIHV